MNAAADSARSIHGALAEAAGDDAVDEFVKLNGSRPQSWFHMGYGDALFNRSVDEREPVDDRAARLWYWAGVVRGWARNENWTRIVGAYDEQSFVRELAAGSRRASAAAVSQIVDAMHRQGRTADIGDVVKADVIVEQPRLFALLLECATSLLRSGDASNAKGIFEMLMRTSKKLEERGSAPPERIVHDAHRRAAHCLRQLHEHARAQEVLERLLEEDPDPNVHAMVHADLGLMAGGFDSLEDVALPIGKAELDGTIERLAKGVDHYKESVKPGMFYSAHGHYCLGVLALGRADSDGKYEDAERHLEQARVRFSQGTAYSDKLFQRTNLYFAIAKSQRLQFDKLAHAADIAVDALKSGAVLPVYHVDNTVEAFGLADDSSLVRRVAESIITSCRKDLLDGVLDDLMSSDAALDHCPLLAEKLMDRASRDNRSADKRAEDWRAALRGFMRAQDYDRARVALDNLQRLAQEGAGRSEFLAILSDSDAHDPAWNLEDAAIASAQCHEVRGDHTRAIGILRKQFHKEAANESELGLHNAHGILSKIRQYGVKESNYQDLVNAYNAKAAAIDDDAGDSVQDRVIRVLVVGGAEQQAKSEEYVRRVLAEKHPNVRPTFVQTGWGANWHRPYEEFKRHADKHHALVILRFMRTNLGRRIREQWPSDRPWRFCWSGGRKALIHTVVRAAAAVR